MKVKIITGLAILVILGGLCLHFFNQSSSIVVPEKSDTTTQTTPDSSSSPKMSPGSRRPGHSTTNGEDAAVITSDASGDLPERQGIEEYLKKNNRNADSLLSAFWISEDIEYLKEAAAKHPQDPRVQLAVISRDLFPDKKREWLNQFKQSSGTNALSFYLSARDYFQNKTPDLAFKDLVEASRNKFYEDFTSEAIVGLEALFAATGKTSASAKTMALSNVPMPHLGILRELANHIFLAQKDYLERGDAASAQTISQVGLEMAAQLNRNEGGVLLVNQLVGLAVENQFLGRLDPQAVYDEKGKTVQGRLEDLKTQRGEIRKLVPLVGEALEQANEADVIAYYEQVQKNGELAALRWLAERTSKKTTP